MPVRYIGGQNWGEDQMFQDETGVDELGINEENLRILTTSNFSLLLAMHHEARPARHHSSRECEVTTVQGGGLVYCRFVYSMFLLLFAVISHTQLNLMCCEMHHTSLQLSKFYKYIKYSFKLNYL